MNWTKLLSSEIRDLFLPMKGHACKVLRHPPIDGDNAGVIDPDIERLLDPEIPKSDVSSRDENGDYENSPDKHTHEGS